MKQKKINFKSLSLTAVLGLASFATQAKEIVYYEPHTGYKEVFDTNNVPDKFRTKEPQNVIRGGSITWNVTYQDVIDSTGAGFDDAALGAGRRSVVDAVVLYVNNVLNPPTASTIDVHWDTSTNVNNSTLASMGTFHFNNSASFSNGLAFDHIITGIDPSGMVVDIVGNINFFHPWTSDLSDPTISQFDLASTILHEITHGLGFAGLSDSTGATSVMHYTVMENLLALSIAGSTDLFTGPNVFAGTTADLASDNVFFTGANARAANGAVNVKIYAPNPYSSGSSISHLDTPTFSPSNQVMVHSTPPGTKRRAYGVIDLGVLQDIGYTAAAANGMVPVELLNFEID